jgi:F-type H+-transporting ATPase subunit b
MIVHVTTWHGELVQVRVATTERVGSAASTTESAASAPNPIAPEPKELFWGAGSFLVFLVLMRLYMFPKIKKGMEARYNGIREDFEKADATRLAAKTDVAAYETALVGVRAEAAARVDKARQTLDQERTALVAEATARITAKRQAADAEISAARVAVRDQVAAAVASVTERTTQLAVGKKPDASVVAQAVQQAMQTGARS